MSTYYGSHKVYIVLSRTGTFVAKGIRRFTGESYSHCSISFDPELKVMYSFARRGIYNPLNAGFIEERLDTGIFGRETETGCAVYCLELPGKDYEKIRGIVLSMLAKKEEYGYNFTGMFMAGINYPVTADKAFFCSQFLAWLMGQVGISIADKEYSLVKPGDVRDRLKAYMIYEGVLQQFPAYHRKHKNIDNKSVLDVDYLKNKAYKRLEEQHDTLVKRLKSVFLGHEEAV